ncbi:hypothetical protein [Halobacterium salinarum]|uniref:hypothetical protein n=1 Tax=Halobacterium salinarum TaxID=2242 RepID=UPI001F379890|nr:hypothetical protein [Halobacterium salinarum]MCF2165434.1 hypothetical protein [Halobacterium salinarum]MCF2168299.1 hypothetical protein [Halobacterium salinarum]
MSNAVSEHFEVNDQAFVIRAEYIDPEEEDALEQVGYTVPTVVYTVFNDDWDIISDHDRHALVRGLPGQDKWLHDQLLRLRSEVVA